jgi:hypothetical protein
MAIRRARHRVPFAETYSTLSDLSGAGRFARASARGV